MIIQFRWIVQMGNIANLSFQFRCFVWSKILSSDLWISRLHGSFSWRMGPPGMYKAYVETGRLNRLGLDISLWSILGRITTRYGQP